MSGSHQKPLTLPPHLAADGWQLHQPYDETTQYDLRTAPQHEADELAALRVEVARLADALNYETRARLELERIVKALEGVISHHADALTVIQLREGL